MKAACAFLPLLLAALYAAVEAPGDKLALVPKGAIVLWPANVTLPEGWKPLPPEMSTNLMWVRKE